MPHGLYFEPAVRMEQSFQSVTPTLTSALDEDISGDGDEPPEESAIRNPYQMNDEFVKTSIKQPAPGQSLLTRALLLNNEDHPRGTESNSTSCRWSIASSVGLTSDEGSTNVSRSPSPHPHPPMALPEMFSGFRKPDLDQVGKKLQILENANNGEGLPKKRVISFACNPSRRSSSDDAPRGRAVSPAPMQRKPATIKFACNTSQAKPATETKPAQATPKQVKTARHHYRRDSQATVVAESPKGTTMFERQRRAMEVPAKLTQTFYEFASSVEEKESWMDEVGDRKRILKVDDLMEKEKRIQKLSRDAARGLDLEETEAINAGEEDEDDDDDNGVEDEDDEDEDEDEDDEDEDEEDDEDDLEDDYLSGNETDIEDGFATDSDDGSEWYFGPRDAQPFVFGIGLLSRRSSASNTFDGEDMIMASAPIIIHRPATPELPDSTDFVCGTLDEDKPLEEAYMQMVEEKRKIKRIITPQDIDPSFPTSDLDDEEDDDHEDDYPRARYSSGNSWMAGAMSSVGSGATRRSNASRRMRSPPPPTNRRRASPAPKRRMASPPPPMSRRGSRQLSPAPPRSTHLSPRPDFLARTKSLPRPGASFRLRKSKDAASSPKAVAMPIARNRGAMDIIRGLEEKRMRRKVHQYKAPSREHRVERGEGEMKMRKLGLGKERPPAQWMMSC